MPPFRDRGERRPDVGHKRHHCAMAGRKLDAWETTGAGVVARMLDGRAEPRDTANGPAATHDFDIETADGRTVALEVTRGADCKTISQWYAAHGKKWTTPRLTNDWWVTLGPVNRQAEIPIIDVVKALIPLLETFERLGCLQVEAWYDMRYFPRPEKTPQELYQALIELYAIGSTGARTLGPRQSVEACILFSLTNGFVGDPERVNVLVEERSRAKVKKLREAAADERHLLVWIDGSEPSAEICISKVGPAITAPEIPDGIDVVWATNPGVEKVWRLRPPGQWEVLDLPASS